MTRRAWEMDCHRGIAPLAVVAVVAVVGATVVVRVLFVLDDATVRSTAAVLT